MAVSVELTSLTFNHTPIPLCDDSAVDTGAKLKFTNARLRFEAQNKLDMFNFAGPIPGGTVS
jgi:hypothetical protein